MATANVEYGHPALRSSWASSVHGPCEFSETLTISGVAALGTALTAIQGGNIDTVARVTSDAACYVAVGTTPNPSLTGARTPASTARRLLPAGIPLDLFIQPGERVGVIAVS